jgi:hypothetical protein
MTGMTSACSSFAVFGAHPDVMQNTGHMVVSVREFMILTIINSPFPDTCFWQP